MAKMRASVALALLLAISGLESFEGRKLRRNSPGMHECSYVCIEWVGLHGHAVNKFASGFAL